MKKLAFIAAVLAAFALNASAQKPDEVLATAAGHKFTIRDLSAETQDTLLKFPEVMKEARKAMLEELINSRVVAAEAVAMGVSSGRLLAIEKAKAPAPTEAEIKKTYDDNKAQLGDVALDKIRENIIAYLRRGAEEKAIKNLIVSLRAKYRPVIGKDINAPVLAPTDVIATVGGKPVTAAEFSKVFAYPIYGIEAEMADRLLSDLDEAILNVLAADEAKALGIDTSTLIARETTNKMKDFSDVERDALNAAFGKKLNDKYKVTLLYKFPEPPVEPVAADDDPSQGPASAPVTVVMFSDFQCSACSATHPLLKEAIAAYPGKVRLVVRDFPLESIHKDSLAAARAAAAANAQGKFFEYIEILYKNQAAQDEASLKKYASDLGLNASQFDIDFKSDKALAEIKKDIADGEAVGINGTPTIFVNGRRVGDLSVDAFKRAIDRALAK